MCRARTTSVSHIPLSRFRTRPRPTPKPKKKKRKSSKGATGRGWIDEQQQSALPIFYARAQRLHSLQRGPATIQSHRNLQWPNLKEGMGPTPAPSPLALQDPAVTGPILRLRWWQKKYRPRQQDYNNVEFFAVGGIDSMAAWW